MTAKLATAARAICPPGVEIDAATVPFGPSLLTRRRDVAFAAGAVLTALAARADNIDAVVIASFSDPGLDAAREYLHCPVLGLCEASVHAACQLGARVGCLLSAMKMVPLVEEKLRAYGLADRVCGIATPDVAPDQGPSSVAGLLRMYASLGRRLIDRAGAEVLVLGGGPLIGLAPRFQAVLPVPVIDSVECALLQAYALASLNPRKALVGSYSPPAGTATVGLSDAAAAVFGAKPARAIGCSPKRRRKP